MLFSFTFEIGSLILGLLYVGHLYFKDVVELIEITNEIDKDEDLKAKDEELKSLSKSMFS